MGDVSVKLLPQIENGKRYQRRMASINLLRD